MNRYNEGNTLLYGGVYADLFNQEGSKTSEMYSDTAIVFNQSDLSPTSWMNKVASKGGTTRAALDSMEDNNVNELIKEAAYAAFDRAVELGK